MSEWADDFFRVWQKAWNTGTEAVLEHVTDDIEYWDVTLSEPIRGRDAYARYCDGFFTAFLAGRYIELHTQDNNKTAAAQA